MSSQETIKINESKINNAIARAKRWLYVATGIYVAYIVLMFFVIDGLPYIMKIWSVVIISVVGPIIGYNYAMIRVYIEKLRTLYDIVNEIQSIIREAQMMQNQIGVDEVDNDA